MQIVTDTDRLDILIEAGGDFERELQHRSGGEPTDLAGLEGSAVVRTWANGEVILTFDVEIVEAENGRFRIKADAEATAAMGRSGVYGIRFTGPTKASTRIVQGRAHWSPGALA